MSGRRWWVVWLSASIAVACSSELTRNNPYDPAAPPSLQAHAALLGQATLLGAASSAGIEVLLDGSATYTTETQADGHFEVGGVVPGFYSVRLSYPGYRAVARSDVELLPGRQTDVGRLVLEPARGVLRGRIATHSDGLAMGGAVVTAWRVAPLPDHPDAASGTRDLASGTSDWPLAPKTGQRHKPR